MATAIVQFQNTDHDVIQSLGFTPSAEQPNAAATVKKLKTGVGQALAIFLASKTSDAESAFGVGRAAAEFTSAMQLASKDPKKIVIQENFSVECVPTQATSDLMYTLVDGGDGVSIQLKDKKKNCTLSAEDLQEHVKLSKVSEAKRKRMCDRFFEYSMASNPVKKKKAERTAKPRPLSGYHVFMAAKRAEGATTLKAIANEWHGLSGDEKDAYNKKAKEKSDAPESVVSGTSAASAASAPSTS